MKNSYIIAVILITWCTPLLAQTPLKPMPRGIKVDYQVQPISLKDLEHTPSAVKRYTGKAQYDVINGALLLDEPAAAVQIQHNSPTGSLWAKGQWLNSPHARKYNKEEKRLAIMQKAMHKMGMTLKGSLHRIAEETKADVDHVRYEHRYQGIPVWGSELTLHQQKNSYSLTGTLSRHPLPTYVPEAMASAGVDAVVQQALHQEGVHVISQEARQRMKPLMEDDAEALIWYPHEGTFRLAWHRTVHPNLMSRWEYFVDAETGQVLDSYPSLCKLHNHPPNGGVDGETTGTGLDLHGQLRTIHTWETQGFQLMIDASRTDMYNQFRSSMPDDPVGTIITLDALSTFPGDDNFKYRDLFSNSSNWDDPVAVSAHTNAAAAYEYFRTVFGRISINGNGGNIISLINVVDEDGRPMDNAFWNGVAIFYGGGNQAFSSPLAKGLDVAAHEMGHGVIQTSANLNYRGESGALNESFADVFGSLIDREDWLIGEDIVDTRIFRSGALRDMRDPTNGGTRLGDPGYQPDHYQTRYTGREDNEGVHINSGIPNKAFYLFATQVGREVAEQVYFTVLTQYLTRSSQFVDLRIAVLDAAQQRFGNQVAQAAANAFDQVGIIGEEGGNYTEDVEVNPGQDFILVADDELATVSLIDPANQLWADPLISGGVVNPPSVTDDGSFIVYVADDLTMRGITFDWNQGTFQPDVLESNPIWRNAVVSKDGLKIAAITDEISDSIYIFSLEQGTFAIYELANPTTAGGDTISTGEVLFADAMEWDHSGEFLMYDAFNVITKSGSDAELTYWDIGFMEVWDEEADTYGSGYITKLFSGLPEDLSVGNPTFAKNSPYIIAFDFVDESEGDPIYQILGVNIETGDLGLIYENTRFGYPSYSRSDDLIIFDTDASDGVNDLVVVAQLGLSESKLSGEGSPSILREFSRWGVWFSNGNRSLSTPILDLQPEDTQITYFPHPVHDRLTLTAPWFAQTDAIELHIRNIQGQLLRSTMHQRPSERIETDLSSMAPGVYLVQLKSGSGLRTIKVVKN